MAKHSLPGGGGDVVLSNYAFDDFFLINCYYRAVWLNIPFLVVVGMLCCLNGLVIYAVYADCDLQADNKIISNDQVGLDG